MESTKFFGTGILKNFFDFYTELFAFLDQEGFIQYHNNKFRDFLGTNDKTLIGENQKDIFPKAVVEWLDYQIPSVYNSLKPVFTTQRFQIGSEYKWFEMKLHPMFDGNEQAISAVLNLRDVTDKYEILYKAEEAADKLRESEAKFHLLFDKMLDGFAYCEVIFDQIGRPVDFKILEMNRVLEELFRIKRDAVVGRRFLDALPDADPFLIAKLTKVGITGSAIRFEYFSKLFNKHFEIVCYSPVLNHFVAILSDITIRKLAELEMIKQSEKLDALLQNSSDIMSIINEQGNIIYMSAAAQKILGISVKDIIGTSFFVQIHPADINLVKENLQSLITFPFDTVVFQYRIRTSDGIFIWLESSGSNKLNNVLIKGIIVNSRDISKQKNEELEKEHLHGQLFHASKLATIGTLAAGIAHEINNPLYIAIGFLEQLRKKITEKKFMDEDMQLSFSKHMSAINRIENIVQGLRSYAYADTDIIDLVDVHKCINDTVSLCENIYKQMFIIIKMKLNAGHFLVKGNSSKIQQVILNLLSNSKDAIAEIRDTGGIITVETSNDGENFIMKVIDDGCGIDANHMSNIFDPFFTTKPPGKGTGLGLSIVYSIVDSFGGSITADTKKGFGTTFTVLLPMAKREEEHKDIIHHSIYEPKIKFSGKVLIIDYDKDVRAQLKDYLRDIGFEVLEAKNGFEALDLVKIKSFDYIFVDIKMPEMDVGKFILETNKRGLSKIIMIIGDKIEKYSDEEKDFIKRYSCGSLKKPFDYHSVYKELETIYIKSLLKK